MHHRFYVWRSRTLDAGYRFQPPSPPCRPRAGCSHGTGLSGFLDKRLEELGLADCAIVILVHGLEILLEGCLIELSVRLDAKEHSAAELAHLVLLELAVSIDVDIGEKLLCRLTQLIFTDLSLGHSAIALSFLECYF